jgi:hypothetical protein
MKTYFHLLQNNVVSLGESQQAFRVNILPPSSESNGQKSEVQRYTKYSALLPAF